MNKSPAFQFYPKDFIMDDKVAIMNMEARGVYITLLSYCWNNKGLSNDQEELKQMCGYPKNWDRIWKKVGVCFYVKGDKLFNKRLDKEARKQKKWKEKSIKGGKRSAQIRWGDREKGKGGYKKVTTKAKARGNSPSSSPSSSSLKDIYTPQFNKFWAEYPNKKEKDVAFGVFKNLKKKEQEQVVTAARNYRIQTEREKQERKFIKHPATFLRKNRWKDHLGAPEKEEMDKFDEMQEKAMEKRK